MNYLHKYSVEGNTLYVVDDKSSKPSGTFTVKQKDWRGRALGKYGIVLSQLGALSFSKKDSELEKKPEPEQEKAPEQKIRALTEAIRKYAYEMIASSGIK